VELLITFLIFAVILIGLYYVTGLIPDATIQKVARVVILVGALIWLVGHIRSLVHAVGGV
jgi:hypothetical protein